MFPEEKENEDPDQDLGSDLQRVMELIREVSR